MPNTREKLIELLLHFDEHCVTELCCEKCTHKNDDDCEVHARADFLIANGVTIQPKGGCDYCREYADGYRMAFGAFSIHNPFHNGEWEISTGHCKPRRIYFCPMCGRKLPQPPKGE